MNTRSQGAGEAVGDERDANLLPTGAKRQWSIRCGQRDGRRCRRLGLRLAHKTGHHGRTEPSRIRSH